MMSRLPAKLKFALALALCVGAGVAWAAVASGPVFPDLEFEGEGFDPETASAEDRVTVKKLIDALRAANPRFQPLSPDDEPEDEFDLDCDFMVWLENGAIRTLALNLESIDSLAPLADFPLTGLLLTGCSADSPEIPDGLNVTRLGIEDSKMLPKLAPLKKLKELYFDINAAACDLTPLTGLPLERLVAIFNESDGAPDSVKPMSLEPLRGMPLKEFYLYPGIVVQERESKTDENPYWQAPKTYVPARVVSLAPLAELPLAKLGLYMDRVDLKSEIEGLAAVRAMPTLKSISPGPYDRLMDAADFWKQYDEAVAEAKDEAAKAP